MNFIHLHRKHSALETPPVTVDFWIFLVRETTRIRYARVSICWSVHLPLGSIPLPTRLLTEASTAVLSSRLSGWEAQKAQEASLCNTHRAVCQALHLLKRSPLGAVSSPGGLWLAMSADTFGCHSWRPEARKAGTPHVVAPTQRPRSLDTRLRNPDLHLGSHSRQLYKVGALSSSALQGKRLRFREVKGTQTGPGGPRPHALNCVTGVVSGLLRAAQGGVISFRLEPSRSVLGF